MVLDAATGTGNFANRIGKAVESADRIIGIDISLSLLNRARAFRNEQIETGSSSNCRYHFLAAAVELLPFAGETFDVVTIRNSLHHLGDPDRALCEMVRVVKPGGILFIMEMHRDHLDLSQLSHVKLHHWGARIDEIEGKIHRRTFTRAKIRELVESSTAVVVSVAEYKPPADPEYDLPGLIRHVKERISKNLGRIRDHEQVDRLQRESESIIEHIQEHGYNGVTETVIVAKRR